MSAVDQAEKPSPYRWYVLAVLSLVYTFYNVDRNLVIILSEPIKDEFHLSDTQLGLLTGASFAVAFGLAGVPLGFLVDRVNRTRLIAGLLTAWSIATAVCALVRSFPSLIVARVVVGAAESGAPPSSLSILSDYFPKGARGTAIGLFYLATPVGLALGFAIGGVLEGMVGWRNVFLIAGAPGVLLSLWVLFTLREPRRGAFEAPETGPPLASSLGRVLTVLWRKKTLLLLLLAAVFSVLGQSGVSAFMPSLFVREHGLPLAQVGLYIALIQGLGGAIGMPLGGVFSDFLSKRSLALGPRMVGVLLLLATPFLLGGVLAPTITLSVACFFAYAVLIHTYLAPTLATYLTLAPAGFRGAMSAALLVCMNLFGTGIGPQITGILSDTFNHSDMAEPLRASMAVVSMFVAVAALFYLAASATTKRDVSRDVLAASSAAPA